MANEIIGSLASVLLRRSADCRTTFSLAPWDHAASAASVKERERFEALASALLTVHAHFGLSGLPELLASTSDAFAVDREPPHSLSSTSTTMSSTDTAHISSSITTDTITFRLFVDVQSLTSLATLEQIKEKA